MSRPHRQVLLIDDDDQERQGIAAYLRDGDFDVVECTTSSEALPKLNQHRPDVVLTALRSPAIDGLAILHHVQAHCPETPVIVVSGTAVVKDVIAALRLGAADYLLKPVVDLEVLVHAIDRALERSELILQNQVYRNELEQANRELTEYVRVLERDQKAGRSVQRKLLPEAPAHFGDFCVDFTLVPSLYLSGDFVDFGLVSGRYLAFYLSDVSGHGAASAFVTIWLKQLVRRYFIDNGIFHSAESFEQDSARLLGLINREVIQSGIGCHMTCFVGVIDTKTREMRYVFGGHLPFPILVTNDGARYLTGKGKPIGIFTDAQWDVHTMTLPERFSLFMFSDGVLEIISPGNDLIEKEAQLLHLTGAHAGGVEALISAMGVDQLELVPDDIAILQVASRNFT